MQKQSGGFGTLVLFGTYWADWPNTKRSYAMLARFVMHRITDATDNRATSHEECRAAQPELT